MARRSLQTTVCAGLLLAWGLSVPASGQTIGEMSVVGYADRLSVQPGETIQFMVSCRLPRYRADLVRLVHGDINPLGPGLKEEVLEAPLNQEYAGEYQALPSGSYVIVPDHPALQQTGSFTLQAWIAPTTPDKGIQGVVTKWSGSENLGYGLVIDEDGNLALWLAGQGGQVQRVRSRKPLRASIPAALYKQLQFTAPQMGATTSWYFVAATFDAATGQVTLYQEPFPAWPADPTHAIVEDTISLKTVGQNNAPLLIGALWASEDDTGSTVVGHYNGKIENPRIFDRALSRAEIATLQQGGDVEGAVAAWDFSADIGSRRVSDTGPHGLVGRTVNMPTRAMTGHNWSAGEMNFRRARAEYGAIYFHDDDLDDAKWRVAFEYQVPTDLKSGVYAVRLRAGGGEDYIPFFVRPRQGTATAAIAFLAPTFSYLAYANAFRHGSELLSLYEHHSDGSGVAYSSRLRPILNMRPKVPKDPTANPHQFNADLHLVDWLEVKGLAYDVITDEDLHWEGASLLEPYNVVLTGSHPEYWSAQMLDGLETYLNAGGRLMYLGGNGFYWITSMDPEKRHTVEVRRNHGTETWEAAPGEYYHSTTGEFGGLWRFRGRPPQQVVGVGFTAQGGGQGVPFQRQPASFDRRVSWVFEGIGSDELIGDNPSLVLEYGAAGSEVDRVEYSLGTPAHTFVLATARGLSDEYQHVTEEVLLSDSRQGGTVHSDVKGDMTYLDYPNGGAVFSASSITWCGSLSYNDYDNTVSQVTENVLRQFASDERLPSATATR